MKVLILVMMLMGVSLQSWAIEEKMDYIEHIKKTVIPFYQNLGQKISLTARDGVKLSAIKFIHPEGKDTIVVLPGWSETHAKYLEVIYDLYQQGYSVYALDHRGQGFSQHLIESNSHISYVDKFEDYINDLQLFVNSVVLKEVSDRPYLLAHSMGGAISLFYLQTSQHYFKAVVLCSPMLQINTKPYPSFVANPLIGVLRALGKGKKYAPGKGDYDPDAIFKDNILTHSEPRFQMFKMMNFIYPETIIGGPSVNWVFEAVKATKKLKGIGEEFSVPLLIFQASGDQIVKIKRQNKLCKRAQNCRLEVFEGAHHEILMEVDAHRNRAIQEILSFFQANP